MTIRRGRAGVVALALGIVALAGCGDEDDAASPSTTTTTTTAPTTAAPPAAEDLTAAVDELCAKTDEIQELLRTLGVSDPSQMEPAQQEQVGALATEAVQLMLPLQGALAQMVPGDAARFQQCAAVIGMGGAPAPGG